MKKYLIFFWVVIFVTGCSPTDKNKVIVAKINNYEITKQEFDEEFKESTFASSDTPESRKEFLNNLISRKLILQDAQKKNLDKDKYFLKMIERFWEQSLMKLALDKKAKQIVGSVSVEDKTILETYNKMSERGKTNKSYDQMYNQIKWEITKFQESELMDNWISELHKKSQIKINYDLLNSNKSN